MIFAFAGVQVFWVVAKCLHCRLHAGRVQVKIDQSNLCGSHELPDVIILRIILSLVSLLGHDSPIIARHIRVIVLFWGRSCLFGKLYGFLVYWLVYLRGEIHWH